uniref:Uncharacterized protein n=1 Tax=Megaviridae environmental sample TaxID=1737588 RepID=A0A5J6VLS9_9VIRU|nr:MAG: hypothetical protein [Megaviridae environmental sample]
MAEIPDEQFNKLQFKPDTEFTKLNELLDELYVLYTIAYEKKYKKNFNAGVKVTNRKKSINFNKEHPYWENCPSRLERLKKKNSYSKKGREMRASKRLNASTASKDNQLIVPLDDLITKFKSCNYDNL